MPRARKTANAALDRIARLPRLPDLVIEGGKRPLAVWLREGNETVQPQVAIWLDSRSGFIRATRVISPLDGTDDGLGETLEALLEAFTGPFLTLPAIPPLDTPLNSRAREKLITSSRHRPSGCAPGGRCARLATKHSSDRQVEPARFEPATSWGAIQIQRFAVLREPCVRFVRTLQ